VYANVNELANNKFNVIVIISALPIMSFKTEKTCSKSLGVDPIIALSSKFSKQ
jgi:hypothetical protein